MFIGSSSCTVDGAGWTAPRSCGLREIADPLTAKSACDKLFESLTSVSVGAMVLDHDACDLIKPSATVNVVPHLDLEARVIDESPNGPVVQTSEGLLRFATNGKYDRTYLQLVRRQLECEKVRLRHDIDGGGTVFASGRNTGDNVSFGMSQNSPKHHCRRPDCPVWLDQERSGISNFDWCFPVSCQNEMPLVVLTNWLFLNTCDVSLDGLQSSRVNPRVPVISLHLKRYLDTTDDPKPDTIFYPVSCCWPTGNSWSSFVAQSVLMKCCLNTDGLDAKTFYVHRYSATIEN